MTEWIARLFRYRGLTRMGHCQRVEDANLGLGWIYYGLARVLRPAKVVVIGSHRGFVPLVLGKALADNTEGGEVLFLDPSLVDDFWADSRNVSTWFGEFGITNIRHVRATTQQFVETEAYRNLGQVGLVFVDGYHTEEQARFDYQAFCDRLTPDGMFLFHDSVRSRVSKMYGPDQVYEHSVFRFLAELKRDPGLQVFDLPLGDGLTLVRRTGG